MVWIREVSFRMRYHTIYLSKYFKQSQTGPSPWPPPVGHYSSVVSLTLYVHTDTRKNNFQALLKIFIYFDAGGADYARKDKKRMT